LSAVSVAGYATEISQASGGSDPGDIDTAKEAVIAFVVEVSSAMWSVLVLVQVLPERFLRRLGFVLSSDLEALAT